MLVGVGFIRSLISPAAAGSDVAAAVDRATAGFVSDPARLPIASPWSSSTNLQRIVFEDIFGSDTPCNTRSAAMKIPAVARGRNLLVSTICRFPFVTKKRDTVLAPAPWITNAGAMSPQLRLALTVDDLIFYGWSCWWRTNGADGFPLAAERIDIDDWTINDDSRVEVHGQVVDDNQVIVIPGLHEGILSFGSQAIQDATSLYRNVRNRLSSPVPQIDLHQTGGRQLTRDERQELIDGWTAARRGANGGVAYSNEVIEVRELGAGGEQLMIEERNATAVEMARLIGVHANLVDATAPKASLNYETTNGRNQELVDFDLPLYMTPITARLSLDDVTARGTHVALDLGEFTNLTPSATGPALED